MSRAKLSNIFMISFFFFGCLFALERTVRKKKLEVALWLLHQMLRCGPGAGPKGQGAWAGRRVLSKGLGVCCQPVPSASSLTGRRGRGREPPPPSHGHTVSLGGTFWMGALRDPAASLASQKLAEKVFSASNLNWPFLPGALL